MTDFTLVQDIEGADDAIRHIGDAKNLYFDTETTGYDGQRFGLDPRRGRVRLMQFQKGDGQIFVVDCYKVPPQKFRRMIEDKRLIGHNIKFDVKMLRGEGIIVKRAWDTMLANQIYTAGFKGIRHNLGSVLEMVLGIEVDKSEQSSDWFPPDLSDSQLAYAATDVLYLPALARELRQALISEGLKRTMSLDMGLIIPAAYMEYAGVRVDLEKTHETVPDFIKAVDKLLKECQKIAKDDTFNPGSPDHVKVFFHQYKKYQRFDSFRADLLNQLSHPLAAKIVEYRKLKKLVGSYLEKFDLVVHPDTGNVHCNINIDDTTTGRFSTSGQKGSKAKKDNPFPAPLWTNGMSLQNIPARGDLGTLMRTLFTAPDGQVVICADYSQIELRIMAGLSGDEHMVKVYREGLDIHDMTTERLGFDPADPGFKTARAQIGKMVNFASPYGITAESLAFKSKGTIKTEAEAQGYIDGFWNGYPDVKRLRDETARWATTERESRTLLGRRRSYPYDGRSNNSVERQAFNHIVQGLSADFMKAAIMEAWNSGLDVRLTVHDELVCYSTPENADEHSRLLEQAMIKGAEKIIAVGNIEWNVPIEADAHWGLSWAAAKEG